MSIHVNNTLNKISNWSSLEIGDPLCLILAKKYVRYDVKIFYILFNDPDNSFTILEIEVLFSKLFDFIVE